jgi:chemotaxis protein CheX
VKAKFVNPFLEASVNLFQEYLDLKVTAASPHLLKDPQSLYEVSGIIGLAGQTTGAVVLSFPRETAMAVVGRMAGKTYLGLTNEVLDGVGELVNIIAGNAKKYLEEFRIVISLPGVIVGTSYKIKWPEGIPVIAIPFESELGIFSVNVSMRDAA